MTQNVRDVCRFCIVTGAAAAAALWLVTADHAEAARGGPCGAALDLVEATVAAGESIAEYEQVVRDECGEGR